MNDKYDGCIIDIIILSIIYNINIIILDKRKISNSIDFNIIGGQFSQYDNNILLYKSISLEKNSFVYNIIEFKNKYVFKKKELPETFIKYIYE